MGFKSPTGLLACGWSKKSIFRVFQEPCIYYINIYHFQSCCAKFESFFSLFCVKEDLHKDTSMCQLIDLSE